MVFSLATAGAWVLAKVMGMAGTGILREALGLFNKAQDGKVRLAEIGSDERKVVYVTNAEQGTERQKAKFNVPVFVAVLAMTIGAPATLFWSVTLYNIFWWSGGIWPQDWGIAEYPPSVAPWAEMAMQWLFDPIGPPAAVGTAGVAAWLTGKRR